MNSAEDIEVQELTSQIKIRIQGKLKDNVVGLYLYGSVVAGDFDPKLSDIDLVAVTKTNLTGEEFVVLKELHDQLAEKYPKWKDRIEVLYITLDGLKNFKTISSKVAEISPGEPFHIKEIGNEWLVSWYAMRQVGITIFGPDIKTIVPDISLGEFKTAIKNRAFLWQDALSEYTTESTRGSIAYAILSLCRDMYGHEKGERVSKKKSAEWASTKFPQWKKLIKEAVEWRKAQWQKNQEVIGNRLPEALEFLEFSINQIVK